MRGWIPVRFDDAIGRELHKYVGEPPARMAGTAELDSVVRRGDVMLCHIDFGIWRSRQLSREREAQRRIKHASDQDPESLGLFASTEGPGFEVDGAPRGESKDQTPFMGGDATAYRKESNDDGVSPKINTKGANLWNAPD